MPTFMKFIKKFVMLFLKHLTRLGLVVILLIVPHLQNSSIKGIGPDFPFMNFEQKKTQAFENYVIALYADLNQKKLNFEALKTGLQGYYKLKQLNKLGNDTLISIADFSQTANSKRLYVIDIRNHKLIHHTYVAHGRNSGTEYANKFSNRPHSNMSSVGFFVTGYVYNGRQGLSLKLMGQEPSNNNAYNRGVVIHGADYVSERFIQQFGRLGRSNGCPAVPHSLNKVLIETLKDSTCFYIHHPNAQYQNQSKFVNQTDFLNCFDLTRMLAKQ